MISAAGVKKSSRLVASRAALVAVAPQRLDAAELVDRARYSRSAARVRSIASGASRRVASTLAQPGDRHPAVELHQLPGPAGDLTDEQAGGVGADVDRRDPHAGRSSPSSSMRSSTQRPTGSAPPARNQA